MIWHGVLQANLGGSGAGTGQTLFDFNASDLPVSLKGFPIDGHIAVQIQHDSVVIPVALKLPPYMGGVTGQATLLADNAHGLQLSSLHIGVPDVLLGALDIKDLSIDYTGASSSWAGAATLNIPAGTPYFGIAVQVRFDNGDFTMGSFAVTVPFPGVPIFTDAYLDGFGGGFDIHPAIRSTGARVRVAVSTSRDSPFEDIRVTGAGAPPTVVLDGPHGRVVPVALGPGAASAAAVAATSTATDTTTVMVRNPGNATWTVCAAPGSSAIASVADARGFAAPSVKAHVGERGAKRRLSYSISNQPGLSVTFAEAARHVYHVLGTTSRAHGSLEFTPAPGSAGTRKIYATVTRDGSGRERRTAATYRAPAPRAPGRVHRLAVRRHGPASRSALPHLRSGVLPRPDHRIGRPPHAARHPPARLDRAGARRAATTRSPVKG